MKILAIADRPPQNPIEQILSSNSVDVIVTLGDLDLYQIQDLENITNIPKLGVYGNHDSGSYMEPLGIQNMHLQTVEISGITFGGFEGSVRYKGTSAPMYTQEEATELMQNFPYVDVFLAHCPPYGINDEPNELAHTGFLALKNYIETKHPKYFLHGHTYPTEENMIREHQDTHIVYVYQDKIIEI